jgi:prepilin-type processing-associated H-X9-DG protein
MIVPVSNVLFLDGHVEDKTYGDLRDQKGVTLYPPGIKRDDGR